MKPIWINKVRKREVKSGYKILSLEIPTIYKMELSREWTISSRQ